MQRLNKGEFVRPGSLWGSYPQRALTNQRDQPSIIAIALNHHQFDRPRQVLESLFSSVSPKTKLRKSLQKRAESIYQQLEQTKNSGAGDSTTIEQQMPRIRGELRKNGHSAITIDAALVCVAQIAILTIGWRPFRSQIECALLLIEQNLVELATGEGKSLATALACAVLGLAGTPVHALTANEYLAQRDAQLFEPLYRHLGLTVSSTGESSTTEEQRIAFSCDITYSTTRCVGFSYLKDDLNQNPSTKILRGLCCAIIDEADVTLLDEASNPLVLSQQINDPNDRLRAFRAIELSRQLKPQIDWTGDRHERTLTKDSLARLNRESIHPWLTLAHRHEQLLTALFALNDLERGRDYLVNDNAIEIIDHYSGRLAKGRQWSNGLHAMVAVKEGLPTPKSTIELAKIQYPTLLNAYHHLAGLSGTLLNDKTELERLYRRPVISVKPHHPSRRITLEPVVFETIDHALTQLAIEVSALSQSGRPVLIASQDVNQTELIKTRLKKNRLQPMCLSAGNAIQEAQIINRAGCSGTITIATQMAGRGTDIKLDSIALKAGGLAVISLQLNQSPRTDRQIMGRAGRQGQPGTVQIWLVKADLQQLANELDQASQTVLLENAHNQPSVEFYRRWQKLASERDRFQRERSIAAHQQWKKKQFASRAN